jgi:hypothetical protein
VRPADATEIDHLAKPRFDRWRDAHELIVLAELTRRRTLASLRGRLRAGIDDIVDELDTMNGRFPLEVWRYRKGVEPRL